MSGIEPCASDTLPLFRHFTIGWITAIETEYQAARQVLDVEYDAKKISLPTGDKNVYTLGRIGEHNVVIATLPPNIYGTRSATAVANGLQRNFPMVRVVLMVGVGGGAPAQSDVRLGDVVVGTRVVPYDFGKIHPDHLEFTGDIEMSNSTLLNGTHKVRAAIMEDKIDIDSMISARFARTERIKDTFRRPEEGTDRLYRSDYCHIEACDCLYDLPHEPGMIVPRSERKSYDRIKVHCGSIGSADKVVKDATERDRLTREHRLLCFEMESAGIIPLFKHLLPIRGICDYSDSHKAKQWQGYAAAAAAVYAKCFLDSIPSADLDTEIPPDADELERYVRLVVQMVTRVTSSSPAGPESGFNDAENAMKEIKESVAMLVNMAEKNSDSMRRISEKQSEDSAAITDAEKDIKRIEEGQKEMREILEQMINYISTQHAASPPDQQSRWEDLHQDATEEASSVEKAAAITEETGRAVGDAAKKAGVLFKNSKMENISNEAGRGVAWVGFLSKASRFIGGDKSGKSKNPQTLSPKPSSPGPSSRPPARRRLPPSPARFPPSPSRCNPRTSPRTSTLSTPPPLPPRSPSPSTRGSFCEQQSAQDNENENAQIVTHVAVVLPRETTRSTRSHQPPSLPPRPSSVLTSTSAESIERYHLRQSTSLQSLDPEGTPTLGDANLNMPRQQSSPQKIPPPLPSRRSFTSLSTRHMHSNPAPSDSDRPHNPTCLQEILMQRQLLESPPERPRQTRPAVPPKARYLAFVSTH